jgi:predicted deacylase
VIRGRLPGPRIWISGGVHGDELNGIEIIRQTLAGIRPYRLAGTIFAAPIVNVFGFITESRYLPDRRDLNRSFPGSPRGSLAARIAHLFMREIVSRCDAGIDLHTGSDHRANMPQIRADLDDPATRGLARAFGAPVAVNSTTRDGSLRAVAGAMGVPVLVYEGGEAHRFDEDAIEAGVMGVRRVLAHMGMIEDPVAAPAEEPREARGTRWVRAGRSGILRVEVHLGDVVEKGQRLGFIGDTYGQRPLAVRAPVNGMVIGITRNPIVNRGDAVANVARLTSLQGGTAE